MASSIKLKLQSKGALSQDAIYVERPADQELRQALLQGDLCYVLAPRQIGKSSLSYRTARWLTSEHQIRCAHIDLSGQGEATDTTEDKEKWYCSLLVELSEALGLDNGRQFYAQRSDQLPVSRWRSYLREQVLGAVPATRTVIFIDEIDYIRALKFNTDEFFSAIREIWNGQSKDGGVKALTFCLLGVASPGELVQSPSLTPFNIGHAVHLEDFRREALATESLASALAPLGEPASAWLDEVFQWTAGHPYMTFELCERLLNERSTLGPTRPITKYVERCVDEAFLRTGRTTDPCLQHTVHRLDHSPRKAELIKLYHRLSIQEALRYDGGDPLQQELILCGMAVPRNEGHRCLLAVRNEIFARVFDHDWVRSQDLQGNYARAIARWLEHQKKKELLLSQLDLPRAVEWFESHWREISFDGYQYLIRSHQKAIETAEAWAKQSKADLLVAEQAKDKVAQRLRVLYVLVVFLLGILSGLSLFAWQQAQAIHRFEKTKPSQTVNARPEPKPTRPE